MKHMCITDVYNPEIFRLQQTVTSIRLTMLIKLAPVTITYIRTQFGYLLIHVFVNKMFL